MALSAVQYFLTRTLFERGLLPHGGALLELGEANWYGDLQPFTVLEDIKSLVADPARREDLVRRLTEIVEHQTATSTFAIVKICYEMFFSPSQMQAIDFDGTETSLKLDLNGPIELGRRFEVVLNNGTAEHVFNMAQVFKTMHDCTLPGGMMIHEGPFVGWIDHGFYTLQPTLFFDLAARNHYGICAMYVGRPGLQSVLQIRSREDVYDMAKAKKFPDNSHLFVFLKKSSEDARFEFPMQGYYGHALTERGMHAWRELR